jgi:hypothetical protein
MNVAWRFGILALTIAVRCSTGSAETAVNYNSYHEGDFHHRSTYEGDVREAMSRQERAAGAAVRDRAEGYQRYISAEQQRLSIWHQAYELKKQIEIDELESIERKADANRQRREGRVTAERLAARRMIAASRAGFRQWPAGLDRDEFACSMRTIESTLSQWNSFDDADQFSRNALATEAGVLQRRVEDHPELRSAATGTGVSGRRARNGAPICVRPFDSAPRSVVLPHLGGS